jgi:ketosteroid isomerase-like protein
MNRKGAERMLTAWLTMLVVFQGGAVGAESADTAALTRLEETWNQAHLRGDAQALEELWAEDLVAVVPRMRVFTRADALAMVRSGRMHFGRYETSDLRVRTYGDAGVVTGRLRRSRTLGAKVVDDDWQFTKMYVRRDGRWKVVAFSASEAPE